MFAKPLCAALQLKMQDILNRKDKLAERKALPPPPSLTPVPQAPRKPVGAQLAIPAPPLPPHPPKAPVTAPEPPRPAPPAQVAPPIVPAQPQRNYYYPPQGFEPKVACANRQRRSLSGIAALTPSQTSVMARSAMIPIECCS